MLTKKEILSISYLLLLFTFYPAYSSTSTENYQRGLLIIDKELLNTAKSAGVSTSNISIGWSIDNSGDFIADIKCNDSSRCKKSEMIVKFSKEEISAALSNQSSGQDINNKFMPMFKNTENNGS